MTMNSGEPTTWGALSSQGVPVIASTASAPPTPIASIPRPPAFGVCESTNEGLTEGKYVGRIIITGTKPDGNKALVNRNRSTTTRTASHEHSRSSVVFEHDLMDNSGARSPKFDPILFGCTL